MKIGRHWDERWGEHCLPQTVHITQATRVNGFFPNLGISSAYAFLCSQPHSDYWVMKLGFQRINLSPHQFNASFWEVLVGNYVVSYDSKILCHGCLPLSLSSAIWFPYREELQTTFFIKQYIGLGKLKIRQTSMSDAIKLFMSSVLLNVLFLLCQELWR